MPVFSDSTTMTTQHESSWDAYIKTTHPTNNFSNNSNVQCGTTDSRGSMSSMRTILAFDLSDLVKRTITSCVVTMKTIAGSNGILSTATFNIYKLSSAPVRDAVTWNLRTSADAWLQAGGDFSSAVTATIGWQNANDTAFTSNDLTPLLTGEEGNMVYLIIKTPETSGTLSKPAIAHDEDSASVVEDVPFLTITSTIDHRDLWNKNQMSKYMNKSRGLTGKGTIPSLTK
jgi:hypothetical protein